MEKREFSLYITATPIGNMRDITLRALDIFKEVDFILCEDTRQTVKLLNYYEIKKPLVSYHKFNEAKSVEGIIEKLSSGQRAALVCDAGTPLISDPGQILIKALIDSGISFCVLPGASALLPSVIMSGFSTSQFCFAGFLPSKKGERTAKLNEYILSAFPVVLYVAPHELKYVLSEIEEISPQSPLCLNKELTKLYEDSYRGSASQIIEMLPENIKGEYTLVIGPKLDEDEQKDFSEDELRSMFDELILKGLDRKGALASLSKKTDIKRNALYSLLFVEE